MFPPLIFRGGSRRTLQSILSRSHFCVSPRKRSVWSNLHQHLFQIRHASRVAETGSWRGIPQLLGASSDLVRDLQSVRPSVASRYTVDSEFALIFSPSQAHIGLSLYDASGQGFLKESDLETYIYELIPTMPQLKHLQAMFLPFYVCTATRLLSLLSKMCVSLSRKEGRHGKRE